MTTLKYLNIFYKLLGKNKNLKHSHLTLYMALYRKWFLNGCRNPISISRPVMMKASKIQSSSTYHKCLKDLQDSGLIYYKPSFNPFKGTDVYIRKLK